MFYRYINYSCPNPDDDHISLAVRRRQPDQTLDAGHRSCIRHSAAAAGVVLTRRAVRLEVLVVVLLAVVGARLVGARNDRVAVVCQCHQKCIAVSSRSSTQDNFFFEGNTQDKN